MRWDHPNRFHAAWRDGKRLSDNCSAHLAFAEDVGGYPASQPNPFEGTIVYG
jgi:hypothetical protein